MVTLYGIRNCDTVRKARRWLDRKGVTYTFHDYREQGLDARTISAWCARVGWEMLLNRRGRTWKEIDPWEKEALDDGRAAALMARYPLLIKRPVLVTGDQLLVGFDEAAYAAVMEASGT